MLATNNAESLPKAGSKYESLLKRLPEFRLCLAPLNSLKYLPDSHTPSEDIWSEHAKNKGTVRGKYVSVSEKVKLQDMLLEIIRDVIIVNVRENVKEVNEAFKHTGLVFFNRDAFVANNDLEFELHVAANCAFMFQDYEEAANLYGKLYERAKKVTSPVSK